MLFSKFTDRSLPIYCGITAVRITLSLWTSGLLEGDRPRAQKDFTKDNVYSYRHKIFQTYIHT